MTDQQFSDRLLSLIFLVGTDGAEDLFSEEYERLLNDVKVSSGPRYRKFEKMKMVLLQQAGYLLRE